MTDSTERLSIDALVTHHTDGFRSGVARFNELLAGHLGVPLKSLTDPAILELRRPLLSVKVTELGCEVAPVVAALTAPGRMWEIFLHEYHGGELERHLVAGAARVNCGNREIYERVRKLNEAANPVWTPGLLNDERTLPDPELAVFSFDETSRRMKVLALNPGITREQVRDNTGFDLIFEDQVNVTEPPTDHELTTLRMLDPDRLFIG